MLPLSGRSKARERAVFCTRYPISCSRSLSLSLILFLQAKESSWARFPVEQWKLIPHNRPHSPPPPPPIGDVPTSASYLPKIV